MKHHPTRVCALPQQPLTCVTVLPTLHLPPHAANGNSSANGTAATNGRTPGSSNSTANGSPGSHSDSSSDGGSGNQGCVLILSASAAQLDLWRLPPPTPADEVTPDEDSSRR